jgi:O-antigen ligase
LSLDAAAGDTSAGPDGRSALASLHLMLPAAATLVMAFSAGGFFPDVVAWGAVALLLLLVARVTLARDPFGGWSLGLSLAAGTLCAFAVWTLLSEVWSHAPIRALAEFDRVLVYALSLALLGSFVRLTGDLDRLLVAVGLALSAVALAALLTRLLPEAFPVTHGPAPSRLAYPLTYWNALGVACALGLVFALHMSAGARSSVAVRVFGAAALPISATALYFTFSRGGIAAAILGLVLYVVLGHPRRLATALPAAVPAAVAVVAAYRADVLATEQYVTAIAEGRRLAVVVAACVVGAILLRSLGVLVDRRVDALPIGARRPRLLAVATGMAVLALAGTFALTDLPDEVNAKASEFLQTGTLPPTTDQRTRLTQVAANGRVEHWRAALDAFEAEPLRGTGAGTFQLEWQQRRETDFQVVNAHSLYLETLSELGIVGVTLLAIALLTPLVMAAMRLGGAERHAHAAFLAAGLAMLIHAAVDWDWEMPGVFLWFPAASGVVLAAAPPGRIRAPGRMTRVLVGLGILLLVVVPATVAVSQRSLTQATKAFAAGDCGSAVRSSLRSLKVLAQRPEPFELLGYCDLRSGQAGLAVMAMRAARARDPRDWQYAYGLAVALALDGKDPRAVAREARQRNPHEALAVALDRALSRSGPRRWNDVAAAAEIPRE